MNSVTIIFALTSILLWTSSYATDHYHPIGCQNFTTIDLDWKEVIEPFGNWTYFYVNFLDYNDKADLKHCGHMNYASVGPHGTHDSDGHIYLTNTYSSDTDGVGEAHVQNFAIKEVKKICDGTWRVSIPETGENRVLTIRVYDKENQIICFSMCNNTCGNEEAHQTTEDHIECIGKSQSSVETFTATYPELIKGGWIVDCPFL